MGSTREGRFGIVVSDWIARDAEPLGDFEVDVIDIARMHFPVDMNRNPDVDNFSARIEAANVIVVLSPEYNHSFSGPLKMAIDSLKEEWRAKPIGFVAYGGMSGGPRSVEALRVVFAELHAVTVSFHFAGSKFDSDDDLIELESVSMAADTMLNQPAWWGHALRNARAGHSYGEPMAVAR